jgi:sarcosine oxidase subunit alpha
MMTNSPQQNRLGAHESQVVDRTRWVTFEFDGLPVRGNEGDTIASALYGAGIRTISRSFKYHRSRGVLCMAGRCANCMVTVDGVPNVRACLVPARNGMDVRHQNAWPSLDNDFLSILDRLDRVLPVGFYYKMFHRPKLFWRLASPIIRRIAGLGALNTESVSDFRYHHENRHADVAVIGGGPAGISAALAAAGSGARVALIDDQPALGGHLRFDARKYRDLPGVPSAQGYKIAAWLGESAHSAEGIEVVSGATAFGLYEDNLLGILSADRMTRLRAQRIVVATGSYEVPLTFDRNDLPGVMLSTGIQRLVHLYGIKPGSTALVATSNDQGYHAALDLLDAGVRIAALADSRPDFPHWLDAAATLRSRGVLILPSHALTRAEGREKVVGGTVARFEDGRPTTEEREIDCDIIAMSGGFQSASSLLQQAGCGTSYDASLDETVPIGLNSTVYAAGEVTGIHDLRASVLQGRLAGLEAIKSLGLASTASRTDAGKIQGELDAAVSEYRSTTFAAPPPVELGQGAKQFVCFCEDVTARELAYAVDEGFEDIQTLKRYSTVTMGPCQGKMCLKSFAAICAQRTNRSADETGVTTSRPPVQPVPLGALAGPSHLPIKRTSIDRKHQELGASMVDLGPWRRAYSYGPPQEECLAVRERVGIIDVSTLGKLDVQGRDAPALLDKVYTHRFSDLRAGRIRYGVLCRDDGTILDDGTVTRLAEDRYFVTTTTGNIELIEEWFKWWTAGTGMCAHVTNVTSAFAAINVAGPRARDTLRKLTDIDLTPGAFRYMRSAQGIVAGVPTIMLRIGFVGESGWELHFPSEYGEHVWDTLMDAGSEFGIATFGLEAQRILRLEKKHIIVGQDTDAVSNPLESDMGWVVKFDKEDFVGRGSLAGIRDRGARDKMVGFVMRDGGVPDDGDPVVVGQAPVGRVTSSRLSPTLGKGIGLAWVPAGLAREGAEIRIRVDGEDLPAEVTMQPFYDPDGVRLRE